MNRPTSETFIGFNTLMLGILIYFSTTYSGHSPLTPAYIWLTTLCIVLGPLIIADDLSGSRLLGKIIFRSHSKECAKEKDNELG